AGAAEDRPAAAAVGVVHGDTGGRAGDRRDVGNGPVAAPGVDLPGGLGLVGRATAAGALGVAGFPDRLGPAARVGRLAQRRATHGDDVRGGGGELRPIALVTGRHGDRD